MNSPPGCCYWRAAMTDWERGLRAEAAQHVEIGFYGLSTSVRLMVPFHGCSPMSGARI